MPSEDFGSLTSFSPVLTDVRLTEALSKWFGDKVKFSHWQYVGEIGKGDSYLSEIIRIKIYGVTQNDGLKHVQVYLKRIPRSVSRRLSFRSDEFFRNEVNFYNIVLPAFLDFQNEKILPEPFTEYVKPFLAYADGCNDIVCVEDVSLQNYRSALRQEGIDIEHCRITLKSLAKFHALSLAMKDQTPTEFENLKNAVREIYYDERLWSWYERFWDRVCKIAIDAVEKEYPDTIYVKKIKEFAVPERYKDMIKAAKNSSTGVISHGDSWTNNFLYKYENRTPADVKIIDFQLTRCASPVLDLTIFIYACTTQELRLKYYEELLRCYYTSLSAFVKDLGSNPKQLYPWQKFMEEIKKYSFLGLAFSLESTPLIVLAPEEALNMDMEGDKIVNIEDVWKIQPFKTKERRLREADNVVFCVDRGYI